MASVGSSRSETDCIQEEMDVEVVEDSCASSRNESKGDEDVSREEELEGGLGGLNDAESPKALKVQMSSPHEKRASAADYSSTPYLGPSMI